MEEVKSGTFGEEGEGSKVTWELSEDGKTLTIGGEGRLTEKILDEVEDMVDVYGDVETLVFLSDKVTLCADIFTDLGFVTTLTFGEGVTAIQGDFDDGDEETDESGWSFTLTKDNDDDVIMTLIGEGSTSTLSVVPSGGTFVNKLVVSEGITELDAGAFQGFSVLKSVTLPDGLETIGTSAFYGCESLTTVDMSKCTNLTTIEYSVDDDGETKEGVLDKSAFDNCTGLKEVTLPASITSIDSSAFNGCVALSAVYVDFGGGVGGVEGSALGTGKVNLINAIKSTELSEDPIEIKSNIETQSIESTSGAVTLTEGTYVISTNTTLASLTLSGNVSIIINKDVTLTIGTGDGENFTGGEISGENTLTIYSDGGALTAGEISVSTFILNGGTLTADKISSGTATLGWTNTNDSIEVSEYGSSVTLSKKFYAETDNVFTSYEGTTTPNGKLSALNGHLVTVPEGMLIEEDTYTRKLGTGTNETIYDCVGNVTLKAAAEGSYLKDDDNKIYESVTKSITEDTDLATNQPYNIFTPTKIDGLNFTVDEETHTGYYAINNTDNLQTLNNYTGSTTGLTFRLTADMAAPEDFSLTNFEGTLDGQNHLLSNVTGNISNGTFENLYYYGTGEISGGTKLYKINLPAGATASGEGVHKFDGTYYATENAEVTLSGGLYKDGDDDLSATFTMTAADVDANNFVRGGHFDDEGDGIWTLTDEGATLNITGSGELTADDLTLTDEEKTAVTKIKIGDVGELILGENVFDGFINEELKIEVSPEMFETVFDQDECHLSSYKEKLTASGVFLEPDDEDYETYKDWTYTLTYTEEDGVILTINGTAVTGDTPFSYAGDPSIINKLVISEGITDITDWLSGYDALKSVSLPGTTKRIHMNVFSACSSLEEINFPAGEISIGSGAFSGCEALKEVDLSACTGLAALEPTDELDENNNTIYEGVANKLANNIFEGCTSLTTVKLPEGLEVIGADAFNGCENLESITLPSSIKTIESGAFYGCNELNEVKVTFDNPVFIGGKVIEAGTETDIAANLKSGQELVTCQTLTGNETTLKGVYYVSANTTLTAETITLDGEVAIILAKDATLTVNGSLTGDTGSSFNFYGGGTLTATGNITADAFNFYGAGTLTANDITAGQMNITWANATDSIEIADGNEIKVEDVEGNKIILGKDFCTGNFTVENKSNGSYYTNFNSNKLYALSGCLVTVPASMVIEGDNARQIFSADGTVAYDCVNGAAVTLKPAEGSYFKAADGKLSTTGQSYTVTENALKKIELKAADFKIFTPDTSDDCTFTVDEQGNGYYEISSTAGFAGLAKYIGTGKTCSGLTFKLTADVALDNDYSLNSFYGTLDAGRYLLTNVTSSIALNTNFGGNGTVSGTLYYHGTTTLKDATRLYMLPTPDANVHCHDDCHRDQDV